MFSKVTDPPKKATQYPSTTITQATNPNNILLLLQAPEVGNCRKAAIRVKETKFLKNGAHGDRGSPDHYESPMPDLSNAPESTCLVCLVVEIKDLKFLIHFFLKKLPKPLGQLGLKKNRSKV